MIRLSVFYPSTEGATFDHDYYRDKHVPLAVKTWGVDGAEIDKGRRRSLRRRRALQVRVARCPGRGHGRRGNRRCMADVANYTTIAPVLQTSEIVG